MTVTLAVVSGVLAAVFLGSGGAKLAGAASMRKSADHFGLSFQNFRLIGVAEVAGAVGLLIGLAVKPLGAAAAIGLFLTMAGAVVYHRRASDSVGETLPAAVLALIAAGLAVLFAQSM
ncbi:DoxX family protein [Streptomyces sp. NPDC001514]